MQIALDNSICHTLSSILIQSLDRPWLFSKLSESILVNAFAIRSKRVADDGMITDGKMDAVTGESTNCNVVLF